MNLFTNRHRLTDTENKGTVTKGEIWQRRDKLGAWDQKIQTTISKIDKQQDPIVQHRELYSISL